MKSVILKNRMLSVLKNDKMIVIDDMMIEHCENIFQYDYDDTLYINYKNHMVIIDILDNEETIYK